MLTKTSNLIEDHAFIGDLCTSALVAKDGTIDFMCLPDFDSEACFASLLGTPGNGFWKICPINEIIEVRRQYRRESLILETELVTAEGIIRITDFMPIRTKFPHLIRLVDGVKGQVKISHILKPRYSNGFTDPLVTARKGAYVAIAGPDALFLRGCNDKVEDASKPEPMVSEFILNAGDRRSFVLSWTRSYEQEPDIINPEFALEETETFWKEWVEDLNVPSEYEDVIIRSLITIKACTYRPTGAIVAAPTFGLPETPGGERNWDYRFCWIRDSVLTLSALLWAGKIDEAKFFGDWLTNAIGGNPSQLQIMYGIRGERHLTEISLDWLEGYGGAKPVRIGNGAYNQFQLDVLGELAAVIYLYVKAIGHLPEQTKNNLEAIAAYVEKVWQEPDHGIWEMRGPKQSFTASKVAAWTAIDRWIRIIDQFEVKTDKSRWEKLRNTIFEEVCSKGYDPIRNTFTQYYGSNQLDASLLVIPMSGFLPPTDKRVLGTVKAIEEDLLEGGFVLRYRTEEGTDGLQGEEGVFLACSFWLANTYKIIGRHEDALELFERVVNLQNDVGLLAEEYLPNKKEQIGNFPQAFSHLALVNSAFTLFGKRRPVGFTEDFNENRPQAQML